jgi:hypothetical protein
MLYLGNYDEYLEKLKSVDHGLNGVPNPHHMEGSIYNHVMAVCEAIENSNLPNILKRVMFAIGFLHDSGKVYQYQNAPEKNRRFFSGHEMASLYASVPYIDRVLKELGVSEYKQLIQKVIGSHGRYYNETSTNTNFYNDFETNSYSQTVYRLIVLFRYFDRQGSISEAGFPFTMPDDRYLEETETMVIVFGNEFCKTYTRKCNELNAEPSVVFLMGLPRSGKSTHRSKILNANFISRDDLISTDEEEYKEIWSKLTPADHSKLDEQVLQNFRESLCWDFPTVVDMTLMSNGNKTFRRKFMNIIEEQNIPVKTAFYMFVRDIEKLREDCLNTRGIGPGVINGMLKGSSLPQDTLNSHTIIFSGQF